MYPWANSLALLSVGSPSMTSTFGLATFHADTQSTNPWPMSLPTFTLSKLTYTRPSGPPLTRRS